MLSSHFPRPQLHFLFFLGCVPTRLALSFAVLRGFIPLPAVTLASAVSLYRNLDRSYAKDDKAWWPTELHAVTSLFILLLSLHPGSRQDVAMWMAVDLILGILAYGVQFFTSDRR